MELVQSTVNPKIMLVRVDANELDCGSKLLPYPTYIGTIDFGAKRFVVWTPAASKPRGYRAAAKVALENILAKGGL